LSSVGYGQLTGIAVLLRRAPGAGGTSLLEFTPASRRLLLSRPVAGHPVRVRFILPSDFEQTRPAAFTQTVAGMSTGLSGGHSSSGTACGKGYLAEVGVATRRSPGLQAS